MSKNNNGKYKGKTAKQWFKLHEVMRADFSRLLTENSEIKRSQNGKIDRIFEIVEADESRRRAIAKAIKTISMG